VTDPDVAAETRRLVRSAGRAVLATTREGWPYASLVLPAADGDGHPLLLLSDLAEHAKNLKADPRCSLLYDATEGLADPLTGFRATVLGEAAPIRDEALLRRYVERHPAAAQYAGFGDFRLYRVTIARAHVVAGFGRIRWVEAAELVGPVTGG
jgi:putative heme iron utilization protein